MKTRKLVPLPSPITKSVSFSSNRRVVYDIIKIKYVDYNVWFSQENTNNVAFEYNGKLTGYDLQLLIIILNM